MNIYWMAHIEYVALAAISDASGGTITHLISDHWEQMAPEPAKEENTR